MKSFTLPFAMIVFIGISHPAFGSSHLARDDASAGAAIDMSSNSTRIDAITDRFLAEAPTKSASCRKYPSVCRLRGSAGPDCCKNSCVNTFTDQSNCGRCGKKCKHGETCCGGQCVNLSFNASHCGRCFNKCSSGDSCSYGLCAYA
ncbi:GRIM REAPER protein [Nymphaea thermarum]|nr:GRIM REAPER protein [Nymphaea thermarum]